MKTPNGNEKLSVNCFPEMLYALEWFRFRLCPREPDLSRAAELLLAFALAHPELIEQAIEAENQYMHQEGFAERGDATSAILNRILEHPRYEQRPPRPGETPPSK